MSDEFNPTEWITTKEAAELTDYHPVHIRRLLREGRIDGQKFGRDWLVDRDSLLSYTEEMKRLGPAKHRPGRESSS